MKWGLTWGTGFSPMELELILQGKVQTGTSTEPEVRWWSLCNAKEVERMGSIAVTYLIQCMLPRPYTLECTQQALVSSKCMCTLVWFIIVVRALAGKVGKIGHAYYLNRQIITSHNITVHFCHHLCPLLISPTAPISTI